MMRLEALVSVALVAVVVLAFFGLYAEEKQWNAFASSHACKQIAHVSGSTFNTFSFDSNGKSIVGIASTPDKTGWLCNDGITYYR